AVLSGLAVDRADVDDAAELARAHAVDDGAAGVEARGEVGADDGVPILPAHAVERAVARDARVVHDDLDRPHLFFDLLDRGLDRVVVADVELLDADSGRLVEFPRRLVFAAVIGDDVVAGLLEADGNRLADAAR